MEKEEETKKKKKKKLKWYVKLFLLIIFIIIYSFTIGTKGIFVKEYQIKTNKIEKGFHGLKILQFSDLHYGSSVNSFDLKKMVNKVNEMKPDVVIFTGDLVDKRHNLNNEEKDLLKKQLSKINSELGKYYVTGEEDFEEETSILNLSGFVNLSNNAELIYNETKTPILLIDKDNCEKYFEENKNTDGYKILIIHNPNDYNKLKKYNFDMVLAGHTHNGQINVYGVKNLINNSKYNKPYQRDSKTLVFVNPGIGTSVINVRLFNHPTINLYRLNKTSK